MSEPRRVESQAEAASTHLSIIAVAPWQQYKAALQPRFGMTAAKALEHALPVTASYDRQLLDRFGLSAGLQVQETLLGGFANRGPEATSSAAAPEGPEGVAAPGFPAFDPARAASLADDRLLQLAAATAIYQEAAILDRYLLDAPLRQDYEPLFVRLQVSVLPKFRNAPYDVYTDIAFNLHDGITEEGYPSRYQEQMRSKPGAPWKAPSWEERARKQPIVLPLLVAENLEVASRADSLQRLRALALELEAGAQYVGAEVAADRLLEKLENAFNRDRNSLFMVARLGETAIRARLGAMLGPSDSFVTLPRQHYISLLLLVPKPREWPEKAEVPHVVQVRMTTTIRDATTGEKLEAGIGAEGQEYRQLLATLIDEFDLTRAACRDSDGKPRTPDKVLRGPLRNAVFRGDWALYTEKYRECFPLADPNSAVNLWNELQQTLNYDHAFTSFEIPAAPKLPEAQTVLLVDDAKSRASIRLPNESGLAPTSISASLDVQLGASGGLVRIPAMGVSAEEGALSIAFPSLQALKPVPQPRSLHLMAAIGSQNYPVRSVGLATKPADPPPAVTLSSSQKAIIADRQGSGHLSVQIDPKATLPVFLEIGGARLIQVSSGGVLRPEDGLVAASSRRVELRLGDLVRGEKVRIAVRSRADGPAASSIELPVRGN